MACNPHKILRKVDGFAVLCRSFGLETLHIVGRKEKRIKRIKRIKKAKTASRLTAMSNAAYMRVNMSCIPSYFCMEPRCPSVSDDRLLTLLFSFEVCGNNCRKNAALNFVFYFPLHMYILFASTRVGNNTQTVVRVLSADLLHSTRWKVRVSLLAYSNRCVLFSLFFSISVYFVLICRTE